MSSVALIGPDGAGKTTIARRLEEAGLLPIRYVYMGINIPASNFALPTSRLAERLKRWRRRSSEGSTPPTSSARRVRRERGVVSRGWAAARVGNRLADAWFRQLVSWYYQLRGFVVLYDRHFVFDFAPEIAAEQPDSIDKRLHRWCLKHLYPRPDLVIFLDAPGEVLFARKGESSVAELERRRQAFLRQGKRLPRFIQVDATRPLDEVFDETARHVLRFCQAGTCESLPDPHQDVRRSSSLF